MYADADGDDSMLRELCDAGSGVTMRLPRGETTLGLSMSVVLQNDAQSVNCPLMLQSRICIICTSRNIAWEQCNETRSVQRVCSIVHDELIPAAAIRCKQPLLDPGTSTAALFPDASLQEICAMAIFS
jgi:hypothetical protein